MVASYKYSSLNNFPFQYNLLQNITLEVILYAICKSIQIDMGFDGLLGAGKEEKRKVGLLVWDISVDSRFGVLDLFWYIWTNRVLEIEIVSILLVKAVQLFLWVCCYLLKPQALYSSFCLTLQCCCCWLRTRSWTATKFHPAPWL